MKFLVILLALLLPLRLVGADRMGLLMAMSQTGAAQAVAQHDASGTGSTDRARPQSRAPVMAVDCPMGMLMSHASGASSADGTSSGSAGCTVCQFCMALASVPQAQGVRPQPAPATRSPVMRERFVSAELQRDLRPPIANS